MAACRWPAVADCIDLCHDDAIIGSSSVQAPMAESGRAPACRSGAIMIATVECRAYATECQDLGSTAGISIQRATVLMAMSRSWTALANQTERLEAILRDEDR